MSTTYTTVTPYEVHGTMRIRKFVWCEVFPDLGGARSSTVLEVKEEDATYYVSTRGSLDTHTAVEYAKLVHRDCTREQIVNHFSNKHTDNVTFATELTAFYEVVRSYVCPRVLDEVPEFVDEWKRGGPTASKRQRVICDEGVAAV